MSREVKRRSSVLTLASGFFVGTLGGLIGLGGAEFRLPLLIGFFGFGALPAVILNKAVSLIVVTTSLPSRAAAIPFSSLLQRWDIIVTLLAGSLAGAWLGAGWATRIKSHTLHRILALLLIGMAALLLLGHGSHATSGPALQGVALAFVGVLAGFGIGVVAALMGVAGGELLIPTITLLFGADVKLAGSLSLAVSLPTMIMGFSRYSLDQSFSVVRAERTFLLIMAAGSIAGAIVGGLLVGVVPSSVLLPLLSAILVVSAIKMVWPQTHARDA